MEWSAFELRLWDGRLGRWMTTDPYAQYHSPYLGMGNSPFNGIDPDGGWWGATLWGAIKKGFGKVKNFFKGNAGAKHSLNHANKLNPGLAIDRGTGTLLAAKPFNEVVITGVMRGGISITHDINAKNEIPPPKGNPDYQIDISNMLGSRGSPNLTSRIGRQVQNYWEAFNSAFDFGQIIGGIVQYFTKPSPPTAPVPRAKLEDATFPPGDSIVPSGSSQKDLEFTLKYMHKGIFDSTKFFGEELKLRLLEGDSTINEK